jgi:hypothetical protein
MVSKSSRQSSIIKSTRHSKIIGSFGEQLVCNWLSRSGFEVCIVDHTGIDIIAYHKELKQGMGISVKARTRLLHTESASVFLFRRPVDRKHLLAACDAFRLQPWLAVYVETESSGDLFLTSLDNYDKKYGTRKATEGWSMAARQVRGYAADTEIKHVHIDFRAGNWWTLPVGGVSVPFQTGC